MNRRYFRDDDFDLTARQGLYGADALRNGEPGYSAFLHWCRENGAGFPVL